MKIFSSTRLLSLVLVLIFALPALAADEDMALSNDPMVKQTVNDVGIVVGAGAAGAIIGLSTLSFYQKPKEHWKNITIGGAIGVIVGVGAVAYLQATRSQAIEDEADDEEEARLKAPGDFSTLARSSWHQENHESHNSKLPSAFNYSFTF
jgi:hypothetical protein